MISLRRPARTSRRLARLGDELWRLIVELELGRGARTNVGVVAARAGDGATTVARALALASAGRERQRTVLVEADPYARPGKRGRAPRGLLDLDRGDPPPFADHPGLPGVAVLPVGNAPPERLASMIADGRIAALAAGLAGGGERTLVVWDLPALRAHGEAKALLGHLSGAILVAECDRTRQADLAFAADEVRGAGVPILAGVLNRAGRFGLDLG